MYIIYRVFVDIDIHRLKLFTPDRHTMHGKDHDFYQKPEFINPGYSWFISAWAAWAPAANGKATAFGSATWPRFQCRQAAAMPHVI